MSVVHQSEKKGGSGCDVGEEAVWRPFVFWLAPCVWRIHWIETHGMSGNALLMRQTYSKQQLLCVPLTPLCVHMGSEYDRHPQVGCLVSCD